MIRTFERNPASSRYLITHLASCMSPHRCNCRRRLRKRRAGRTCLRSGPQVIDTSSNDSSDCSDYHLRCGKGSADVTSSSSSSSSCSSAGCSSVEEEELSLELFEESAYDKPEPLLCPMQHPDIAYRIDSDGDQVFILASPPISRSS